MRPPTWYWPKIDREASQIAGKKMKNFNRVSFSKYKKTIIKYEKERGCHSKLRIQNKCKLNLHPNTS